MSKTSELQAKSLSTTTSTQFNQGKIQQTAVCTVGDQNAISAPCIPLTQPPENGAKRHTQNGGKGHIS